MSETNEKLIIGNMAVYSAVPYDESLKVEDLGDFTKAYVKGIYYYPFRGQYRPKKSVLTGVYIDNNKIRFVEPLLDKDKEEYLVDTHWANPKPQDIANMISKNQSAHIIFDSKSLNLPDIKANSDVLKRALLEAFYAKGIDTDFCKERFPDRNAHFNFKQVLKDDDARMSILLFERGADALDMDYYIILTDRHPESPIGNPIDSDNSKAKINALLKQAGIHSVEPNGSYYIMTSSADRHEMYGDI